MSHPVTLSRRFADFSSQVAHASGKPLTFALSVGVIVAWALCGPIFGFSDTWQLVINTSTTVVTFLMVFLIQSTQNRDSAAIQAKLDELIRASAAHNSYIGIEHLTEEELAALRTSDEFIERADRLDAAYSAADSAEEAANAKARRAVDRIAGA